MPMPGRPGVPDGPDGPGRPGDPPGPAGPGGPVWVRTGSGAGELTVRTATAAEVMDAAPRVAARAKAIAGVRKILTARLVVPLSIGLLHGFTRLGFGQRGRQWA